MRSLGTTTSYAAAVQKHQTKAAKKYALQQTAQRILHNERVHMCCKYAVPEANTVDLVVNEARTRAGFTNTMKCGSVWACPVCAPRS